MNDTVLVTPDNALLVVMGDCDVNDTVLVTPDNALLVVMGGCDNLLIGLHEPGPAGGKGDKGDPGTYEGEVAPCAVDPILLFENALI